VLVARLLDEEDLPRGLRQRRRPGRVRAVLDDARAPVAVGVVDVEEVVARVVRVERDREQVGVASPEPALLRAVKALAALA